MKKEFHLVLGFDTHNEKLMETYKEIVIKHARLIYFAAVVGHGAIRDGGTKPDIHLYSDDFLAGKEDIDTKNEAGTPAAAAQLKAVEQEPEATLATTTAGPSSKVANNKSNDEGGFGEEG